MQFANFDLKNKGFYLLLFFTIPFISKAQLSPECQLDIGTNMAGLADYGTEIPFVDLMKTCRTWYTKDVGNPNAAFDSGNAGNLSYRTDGYPTHVPQTIPESTYPQKVVTIWAITDGWPAGTGYVILWEGTGTFNFFGTHQNLNYTGSHRITFDMPNPTDGVFELTIETSDINDPIRNIRVLMPGTENTHETSPFNSIWLNRLLDLKSVRFMDWGQTNNWGQDGGNWNDPTLFDWADRSQMDHYTWAYEKGVPYEMMVKLLNDYDLDGWICVPHRASDNYMSNMANYFRDNLESDRHLTVEYSNEIWNWIFGQTQWLNQYGCIQTGTDWPEGIAPYVQNCLDHFTTSFAGQLHRITRVVGAFAGWPDITQIIVDNMIPGTFDAISPTWYFNFTDAGEQALDALGSSATAADIAFYARQGMPEMMMYLSQHKTDIADPIGVPLIFYEGGQHLTPTPFGVEPSYAQALLDIQRDTAMFNMYNEWFDEIRTLQSGSEPLKLMHFSYVSHRSSQYGSWGMLETMDQDINITPAPKYSAIIDNLSPPTCEAALSVDWNDFEVFEDNCRSRIYWSTIQEYNNSHFIIERSKDGNQFEEIAEIEGTGNSNEVQYYQYYDQSINGGQYYYRIKQVDLNGAISILGIRELTLDCTGNPGILIFPNPVKNVLNISILNSLEADGISIYNSNGQLVLEQGGLLLRKGSLQSFNVSKLPSGIYMANLALKGRTINSIRFVK